MSEFQVGLRWQLDGDTFDPENYDRGHTIRYGGGAVLEASAAPSYKGDPAKVNPEEALLGSLMSCHMLTFLALAAKAGYAIKGYEDEAAASLGKNEDRLNYIDMVHLRPKVTFVGDKQPDAQQLQTLHEKAHKYCFIANTICSKIEVEPRT
jgi:organic hydroperoxide reductase OsmC/OhrA